MVGGLRGTVAVFALQACFHGRLAERDIYEHMASGQTVNSRCWKLEADPYALRASGWSKPTQFMQNKLTAGSCLITVITSDYFFSLLFNSGEGKKSGKI